MELSKILGVKRFKVKDYIGSEFRITVNGDGVEHIQFKAGGDDWEQCPNQIIYDVIHGAPDNIIHLPPELTEEQREQLMAIYTLGGRWIAKDCNDKIFYYFDSPSEYNGYWREESQVNNGYGLVLLRSLSVCEIPSVFDTEPFDIAKALGVEG